MIFASLEPANGRVHVHNKRNFPQAKFDSKIKCSISFNLNEHAYGDLFLEHNNSEHIILFNFF